MRILIISFFLISNIFAQSKITYLKGNATLNDKKVKQNDEVQKGDVIKTMASSLVIIKLADGSRLNIGPESEVKIQDYGKDSPSLIDLVMGQIRSHVAPQKNKSRGFMVKTKSAAMGVRGTEFSVSYNPENRKTTLLTFEGNVAILPIKKDYSLNALKKMLEGNKPKEIKAGQVSIISYTSMRARRMKMNPAQFQYMKNIQLKKPSPYELVASDKEAEEEEFEASKDGVFIDFNGGNLYKSGQKGTLNKDNGNFKVKPQKKREPNNKKQEFELL